MGTAYVTYEKVEFIIKADVTICNIFYSSTEPGTPWGGGWKNKLFLKDKTLVEILIDDVGDFLTWDDGKSE
jgi:hypothetical protein